MKLFQINIKSPLSLLQNFHQMTFMTYTASTEIIYAHTIISRRFTEMKRNTDYVHKILSWLVYKSYSDDRKWRIAACRHRMLCLLESPTNGSINTLFKNYPSILYMSNPFLNSVWRHRQKVRFESRASRKSVRIYLVCLCTIAMGNQVRIAKMRLNVATLGWA